jgi:hypothetical protein
LRPEFLAASLTRQAARLPEENLMDVQDEIELLQIDISKANAAIDKAVRERRAINKDSPLVADFNAAVVAARQALNAVEVKLRTLYESKGDD